MNIEKFKLLDTYKKCKPLLQKILSVGMDPFRLTKGMDSVEITRYGDTVEDSRKMVDYLLANGRIGNILDAGKSISEYLKLNTKYTEFELNSVYQNTGKQFKDYYNNILRRFYMLGKESIDGASSSSKWPPNIGISQLGEKDVSMGGVDRLMGGLLKIEFKQPVANMPYTLDILNNYTDIAININGKATVDVISMITDGVQLRRSGIIDTTKLVITCNGPNITNNTIYHTGLNTNFVDILVKGAKLEGDHAVLRSPLPLASIDGFLAIKGSAIMKGLLAYRVHNSQGTEYILYNFSDTDKLALLQPHIEGLRFMIKYYGIFQRQLEYLLNFIQQSNETTLSPQHYYTNLLAEDRISKYKGTLENANRIYQQHIDNNTHLTDEELSNIPN